MAINFEKAAMTLHKSNHRELEKRENKNNNTSWIADAALTRYFSIINMGKKELAESQLDEKAIRYLRAVYAEVGLNNRNTSIPMLRQLFKTWEEEGLIASFYLVEIEKLSVPGFAALVDELERVVE